MGVFFSDSGISFLQTAPDGIGHSAGQTLCCFLTDFLHRGGAVGVEGIKHTGKVNGSQHCSGNDDNIHHKAGYQGYQAEYQRVHDQIE